MSEPIIEYRAEFNTMDFVNKYAEHISRIIDEQTLERVEHQLEEFGYVKVVRCRNCKFCCFDECTRIDEGFKDYWFAIEPEGFCKWGERE